jgi:hypothetical protein
MEGHCSRIEQREDRISELEDEIVIKGKTKMQELTDSIKRPNLRILGIKEGEEVQAKGMCELFNKIIAENLPNMEKTIHIQVHEASREPNRLD